VLITYRCCTETWAAAFLSFDWAVFGFSVVEPLRSVVEGFRIGVGFGEVEVPLVASSFGVPGAVDGWELILLSDLIASLVENIRVRRFVIEGLSVAVSAGAGFCGSDSGAACPLRLSMGTEMPFCPGAASASEDPTIDDVREAVGERRSFSTLMESLGALTVAMFLQRGRANCNCERSDVRSSVQGWMRDREGGRQGSAGKARTLSDLEVTKSQSDLWHRLEMEM
jgi:hypothetical protein